MRVKDPCTSRHHTLQSAAIRDESGSGGEYGSVMKMDRVHKTKHIPQYYPQFFNSLNFTVDFLDYNIYLKKIRIKLYLRTS